MDYSTGKLSFIFIAAVVLMDQRSFQAHNAGCRHALKVLARTPRLARVVVLQSLFVARPAHELGLSPAAARAHDARP